MPLRGVVARARVCQLRQLGTHTGARACVACIPTPSNPVYTLLGFRVLPPNPPSKGGLARASHVRWLPLRCGGPLARWGPALALESAGALGSATAVMAAASAREGPPARRCPPLRWWLQLRHLRRVRQAAGFCVVPGVRASETTCFCVISGVGVANATRVYVVPGAGTPKTTRFA